MAIVRFEKTRYTVDTMYQWDKNQILKIYGLSLASKPEIHFSNAGMDRAVVGQASMDDLGVITANVPNSFLQKSLPIYVYIGVYEGESFKTLYTIIIPIKGRQKPNDYTLEDDPELYSFNYLENKFNNTVGEAMTAYQNAAAQHLATVEQITDLMANQTAEFNEAMGEIDNVLSGGATEDIKTKFEGFDAHVENEENPHNVTKEQVGIGYEFVKDKEILPVNDSVTMAAYARCENQDNPPRAFVFSVRTEKSNGVITNSAVSSIVALGDTVEVVVDGLTVNVIYRNSFAVTSGYAIGAYCADSFDDDVQRLYFTAIGIY